MANSMIALLWWDKIFKTCKTSLCWLVGLLRANSAAVTGGGAGGKAGVVRYVVVVPVGVSEFPILNDKRDGVFSLTENNSST